MKVLIVIDMLKDFMDKNAPLYCGEEGRAIIPFIKQKMDEYRRSGDKIVYVCDAHDPRDKEFQMFKPHAVKGSSGAEVIDELKPQEGDIIVEKTTVRTFYDTNLDRVLKELNPEEVCVLGVCTSICIMETVGALRVRGYKAVVYKDGVADFDSDAHDYALKRMVSVYGAEIR